MTSIFPKGIAFCYYKRRHHILLKSAPSSPPYMKYIAMFCPPQYQDSQGGPRGQIMEGQSRLKKHITGFQADGVKKKLLFQYTWFSNNKGFCLEIHSFTLNFVKLFYLIIWDATTNLIRFYWNWVSRCSVYDLVKQKNCLSVLFVLKWQMILSGNLKLGICSFTLTFV